MTTLTIKLPEALKVRLEAEARLTGRSVSALVRDSLVQTTGQPKKSKTSLYDRTKDLCGAGKSGVRDLATNARHLKDFGAWRG